VLIFDLFGHCKVRARVRLACDDITSFRIVALKNGDPAKSMFYSRTRSKQKIRKHAVLPDRSIVKI
jgi:hypothetical protein